MTAHFWVPSTLGHGESMCRYCLITNREAAVLGMMNSPCQYAPNDLPTFTNSESKTDDLGDLHERLEDDFKGDNADLILCIKALIALDSAGALVPHSIGGHARSLLSAAAVRIRSLEGENARLTEEEANWQASCDFQIRGAKAARARTESAEASLAKAVEGLEKIANGNFQTGYPSEGIAGETLASIRQEPKG